MNEAFWAQLDVRIAAHRAGIPQDAPSDEESAHPPRTARPGERDAVGEALGALLRQARQEIRALEALLQVRQAEADLRLREAEMRATAASLRADAAEDWLRRIEHASRDLLPGARGAARRPPR